MERTPPDFEHFIAALSDAGVDFVIVGGYAMVLHGSDYVTSDIDFAVACDRENARKVARALSEDEPRSEGWPEGLPFVWDEETVRRAKILTLLTRKGSIDVLGETPGLTPTPNCGIERCGTKFMAGGCAWRRSTISSV